ncbi:MAG: type IV secretion system protein TraC [Steroidobacteraceae bacterium]
MEITQLHNRLLERKPPSGLLSALAYDPERRLYFHGDGCLGYMFGCYPIVGVDERIIQQLQPLLSQPYPVNTVLQVSLWTSPDIEDQLLMMRALRTPKTSNASSSGRKIATGLVNSRADYLRYHTQEPVSDLFPTRVRDIQVIVSAKIPCRGAIPTDADAEQASRLRTSTEQILRTLGMGPVALDPELYIRLIGTMVNWGENASWRSPSQIYDDKRPIRDQVFDPETFVQVDDAGLWLAKKRARTLCVKRLPEFVHLIQAAQFLGDLKAGNRGVRDSMLITLNVLLIDAEQSRTAMGAKKNTATWQSMGPLARYLPRLRKQKEDFDVLFEALEDGDRVVKAYLTFCLFSDSDEQSTEAASNAITYYRELGYRLQEDRYVALPVFLNALPGNADPAAAKNLMRYRTMASRHAVQLMPCIADWKGTGSPVMTLLSRNGQFMAIDLFDSPTNYSALVAAESGSGKSFFVNFLLTAYMSLGADVYLIEVGRSYKNLCQVLGGEHLEFNSTSDISLNPFSAIENYDEQSDFTMAGLLAMVSPKGDISEYQESTLRRVTRELWDERGKSLTIDFLAERLLGFRDADGRLDARVNDLGSQLYPFTTRGEYGRWVDRPSTVTFQKSLTVCELEELKGRRHLMRFVLVQLMAAIQRAMYLRDDGRPKLLIVDEAWDLITEGPEGAFIERGCRQLRKYFGGAVLILQSVNDLYRTPVGEAIWENCANKFLLGQTPEAIDGLVKNGRLALGEGAGEILKTVRTEPGAFSELWVYTRSGSGIARLIVDRRTQLLYSTDPKDKHAIAQRIKAGMDLEAAIEDILRGEGASLRRAG